MEMRNNVKAKAEARKKLKEMYEYSLTALKFPPDHPTRIRYFNRFDGACALYRLLFNELVNTEGTRLKYVAVSENDELTSTDILKRGHELGLLDGQLLALKLEVKRLEYANTYTEFRTENIRINKALIKDLELRIKDLKATRTKLLQGLEEEYKQSGIKIPKA